MISCDATCYLYFSLFRASERRASVILKTNNRKRSMKRSISIDYIIVGRRNAFSVTSLWSNRGHKSPWRVSPSKGSTGVEHAESQMTSLFHANSNLKIKGETRTRHHHSHISSSFESSSSSCHKSSQEEEDLIQTAYIKTMRTQLLFCLLVFVVTRVSSQARKKHHDLVQEPISTADIVNCV